MNVVKKTEERNEMNYFRAQTHGYSFEQMKNHVSVDGGDDGGTAGICACDSVTDLLRNTVMGAMDPTDDVVIFTANRIARIYDGYRVEPVAEIVRFSVADFRRDAAKIADEYENWQ